MSAPGQVELAHANYTENGHCKCCCNRWHPVKRKGRPGLWNYDLVWSPKRRCTCHEWHKPQEHQ